MKELSEKYQQYPWRVWYWSRAGHVSLSFYDS